jgi:hypothetical protein
MLFSSEAIAAGKMGKDEERATMASPEYVADLAEIRNDPLDTFIRINTSPFYIQRQGLLKVANNDKYMRAIIDKETGRTVYQLYMWVSYTGDWAFFNRLNYESSSGPKSAIFHEIDRKVGYCGRYLGCTLTEHFAADIPEEVLRQIADGAQAGDGRTWRFRVYGKGVDGVNSELLRTEVAGILIAVERQRLKLGFTTHPR